MLSREQKKKKTKGIIHFIAEPAAQQKIKQTKATITTYDKNNYKHIRPQNKRMDANKGLLKLKPELELRLKLKALLEE